MSQRSQRPQVLERFAGSLEPIRLGRNDCAVDFGGVKSLRVAVVAVPKAPRGAVAEPSCCLTPNIAKLATGVEKEPPSNPGDPSDVRVIPTRQNILLPGTRTRNT